MPAIRRPVSAPDHPAEHRAEPKGQSLPSGLDMAMAPLAPLTAMWTSYAQAYGDLWASQWRYGLAASRTAADAWRLAVRRQQDAMLGASTPAPTSQIEDDAKAVETAATAVRNASLDWMHAQVRALELIRTSA